MTVYDFEDSEGLETSVILSETKDLTTFAIAGNKNRAGVIRSLISAQCAERAD